MGGIGFWQIIIVAVLVLLLFGRGKISELMGDVAKGIRSFKKGLSEDDKDGGEKPAHTIEHQPSKEAEADKSKDNAVNR
jgi:sec-independent protein translocase protein TatA